MQSTVVVSYRTFHELTFIAITSCWLFRSVLVFATLEQPNESCWFCIMSRWSLFGSTGNPGTQIGALTSLARFSSFIKFSLPPYHGVQTWTTPAIQDPVLQIPARPVLAVTDKFRLLMRNGTLRIILRHNGHPDIRECLLERLCRHRITCFFCFTTVLERLLSERLCLTPTVAACWCQVWRLSLLWRTLSLEVFVRFRV